MYDNFIIPSTMIIKVIFYTFTRNDLSQIKRLSCNFPRFNLNIQTFLKLYNLGHPYQVYYYNNILFLYIQKRKQGMQSCIPLSFTSSFVSYWCFCFYFCYFVHSYW